VIGVGREGKKEGRGRRAIRVNEQRKGGIRHGGNKRGEDDLRRQEHT
jgi:hypothetical protein